MSITREQDFLGLRLKVFSWSLHLLMETNMILNDNQTVSTVWWLNAMNR
jgi:hypothetical protein